MVLLSAMPYIKDLMFILSDQHTIHICGLCNISALFGSLLNAHNVDLIADLVCLVHCVRLIQKNKTTTSCVPFARLGAQQV